MLTCDRNLVSLHELFTGMSPEPLIAASIVGRGIQFFGVAAVVWYFGDRAKALIQKHMTLVAILFAVVLIGGFVAVKYLA